MFKKRTLKYFPQLLYAAVLLVLIACSNQTFDLRHLVYDHETKGFNPQDISCTDQSTVDSRAKIEAISHNPNGDLYWFSHSQEILAFTRSVANQGSPFGMAGFGELQRKFLIVEHTQGKGGDSRLPLPAGDKADMVIALTYIYLSANIEWEHRAEELAFIHRMETDALGTKIPLEWIAEAKLNATRWKEYCDREQ